MNQTLSRNMIYDAMADTSLIILCMAKLLSQPGLDFVVRIIDTNSSSLA